MLFRRTFGIESRERKCGVLFTLIRTCVICARRTFVCNECSRTAVTKHRLDEGIAAEARKADGAIVTADLRPNPTVGTSATVGFVGNCNSLNTIVSRAPPTVARKFFQLRCRIFFHLPCSMFSWGVEEDSSSIYQMPEINPDIRHSALFLTGSATCR